MALGIAMSAAAGSAQAGQYDIGSLATPFLQSKTQMTILSHDDLAAPGCSQKHFVKASPAGSPSMGGGDTMVERKWQEQWTLDRCGVQVSYWVFFTEVGQGGAYYAIVDPQQPDQGDVRQAELPRQ